MGEQLRGACRSQGGTQNQTLPGQTTVDSILWSLVASSAHQRELGLCMVKAEGKRHEPQGSSSVLQPRYRQGTWEF